MIPTELTEEQAAKVGSALAKLFCLLPIEAGVDPKYQTQWGSKTRIGLGRCVLRLMREELGIPHKRSPKLTSGIFDTRRDLEVWVCTVYWSGTANLSEVARRAGISSTTAAKILKDNPKQPERVPR